MGNTPPTGGIRPANSDYSCVATIAPSVAIEFTGRNVEQHGDEGESTELWGMKYNIGRTRCYFHLCKTFKYSMSSPTPVDEKLRITITEGPYQLFTLNLKRVEDGLLDPVLTRLVVQPSSHFENRTVNENSRNLFVWENKFRSKDENPYMVTVAHYYVNTEDGKDVGLSVAVLPNGPEKHPTSALLYMLDEVRRTKTWKPTFCHHCADNIIQRQRASIWQTDSEDSDIENVHRPRQNTGSLLVNDGRFKGGNNNGNLNIRNFFFRHRRR